MAPPVNINSAPAPAPAPAPTHVRISDPALHNAMVAQREKIEDGISNNTTPGQRADEYQAFQSLWRIAAATGYDERSRSAARRAHRSGNVEGAKAMLDLELGSIDQLYAARGIPIRNYLNFATQEGLEAWGVPAHIARTIDIEKTTPGADGNPYGVGNSHVFDKMRAGGIDRSRFDKRAYERAQAAMDDTRASLAGGSEGTDLDKPEFREKLAIDIWGAVNAMHPFSRVGASFDAAKEVGVIKHLGAHFARAIDTERKSTGAVGASSEDVGLREGIQAYAQMSSNANIQANWAFVRGIVDGSSELSALLNPEARASTVVAGVSRIADRARAIASKLAPLTETEGTHTQEVLIYGLAQQESLGLFAPNLEMSQQYRSLMTKLGSAYAGTARALAKGDTGDIISSVLRTTEALGGNVQGRVATLLGPNASQEDLDAATKAGTAITSVTPEQLDRGLARDGFNKIPLSQLRAKYEESPANAGRRHPDATRIFDAAAAQLEQAAAPKPLSMDEVFAGGRDLGSGLTSKNQVAAFNKEVGFAKLWKKSAPSRIGEMAITAFNTVSPMNVEAWRKAGSLAVDGVTTAGRALQGETPIETVLKRRVHAGTFNAAVSELVTFVEAKDIVHGRFKMSDRDLVERALKLGKYKLDDNGVPTSDGVPADYPGIQELLEQSKADRIFTFTADDGTEVKIDLLDSNDNMRLYTGATYSERTSDGKSLPEILAQDDIAFAAYDAAIEAKETISRLATASGLNSRLGGARGAPLLQAHFDLGSLLKVAGPPGMADTVVRLVDRDAKQESVLAKMAQEHRAAIEDTKRERGEGAAKELARAALSLYKGKVAAHLKGSDGMEPAEAERAQWRRESMAEARANLTAFNPQ